MEWTLFLDNLNALSEWIDDIDIVDCVLVNLVQKYPNPTRAPGLMRTDKGSVWINHTYILEQLPFLKVSLSTLRKRLKRLVDVGILEREDLYPQTEKGVRQNTCYRLSESFVEICQYYKAIQGIHSNRELGEEEKRHKLAFLLKGKPKIPHMAVGSHTGSYPQTKGERDEKGRYRTVTDSHTRW